MIPSTLVFAIGCVVEASWRIVSGEEYGRRHGLMTGDETRLGVWTLESEGPGAVRGHLRTSAAFAWGIGAYINASSACIITCFFHEIRCTNACVYIAGFRDAMSRKYREKARICKNVFSVSAGVMPL